MSSEFCLVTLKESITPAILEKWRAVGNRNVKVLVNQILRRGGFSVQRYSPLGPQDPLIIHCELCLKRGGFPAVSPAEIAETVEKHRQICPKTVRPRYSDHSDSDEDPDE
jgi:hypothetical protein